MFLEKLKRNILFCGPFEHKLYNIEKKPKISQGAEHNVHKYKCTSKMSMFPKMNEKELYYFGAFKYSSSKIF